MIIEYTQIKTVGVRVGSDSFNFPASKPGLVVVEVFPELTGREITDAKAAARMNATESLT